MSDIDELQGRIVAAMQRIRSGLGELGPIVEVPDPAIAQALETALEEERLANAQLEERMRSLIDRHAGEVDALKREVEAQSLAMARLDMDMQRLRQANDQLRDSNAKLRAANEEGVGAPELINKAMLAELEALRATRATETAEAGAILARLQPLLAAAADPAGDEPSEEPLSGEET
ncbi:hypothetical protein [Marinibacterium profundimaris]|uniref:hypothetical protein n=1 Tax=Marinibacterium profundimaris TaxID=1679460 RepID=UPI000B523A8E|nr:hypothetical protein [Marinibacterium profundimaris]